jgi:patatin-like phospholipase/acyl hydrolase
VRVLTLDGGGMRGLFEAYVLAALEDAVGAPAARVFDLVSGTSSGGIVALGLATGKPAREIAMLYETRGPRIFARSPLTGLRGLLVSKYPRRRLDETLRDALGDARLSDAATRVLVPAFSLERRDLVWFDSGARTAPGRVKVAAGDPLARDVAAATSAAPTFFDPVRVDGLDGEWLDGGVGANDPTPYALAVALGNRPPDVLALSIGTGGFFPSYPRRLRGALRVGLCAMPGLILYPTGLVAHDTADALAHVTDAIRLVRVAPEPNSVPLKLDDASPDAIRRLRAEAERVVAGEALQALFSELTRSSA